MSTDMKLLHEVVIDSLELHAGHELPLLDFGPCSRRLVVGSGSACAVGRVVFRDEGAVFADTRRYGHVLKRIPSIDSAVVISASEPKEGAVIVVDLKGRGLETFLLTCVADSPAALLLDAGHAVVTRSCAEPIGYDISTYMGMILAKTREDPRQILEHINARVAGCIPDMRRFRAFYLLLPPRFEAHRELFLSKFDVLFGPMLTGRCYTTEQTLHGKTLVSSDKELFISFGFENRILGNREARLNIPVPKGVSDGAMMAIGCYVIGRIQDQFPPWYFGSVSTYQEQRLVLFEGLMAKTESGHP